MGCLGGGRRVLLSRKMGIAKSLSIAAWALWLASPLLWIFGDVDLDASLLIGTTSLVMLLAASRKVEALARPQRNEP